LEYRGILTEEMPDGASDHYVMEFDHNRKKMWYVRTEIKY